MPDPLPVTASALPTSTERLRDALGRPLRSLRLSVTDRCNLRCSYCMPEPDYVWLPKKELLTFEELDRITGIFCTLGVDKVRLTGGEPLLRSEITTLVRELAARPGIRDLAMTTNGVLLAERARNLREAGLRRLTVSLDTLRPERFQALTRADLHARVLAGIEAARAEGFPLKLDTVVVRGTNDDEVL
ncbi:MAG TPA: radical SAM protein, partial [Myxococcaceae bacterium]|nr:radical SAM protein [Myxococcaceae bacterium]